MKLQLFLLSFTLSCSSVLAFTSSSSSHHEKKISWPEYKSDYIDPMITAHEDQSLEGHMDPAKRQVSDQYWLKQYAEEKEKLHRLNEAAAAENLQQQQREDHRPRRAAPSTSYDAYKMNYIDPMDQQQKKDKKKFTLLKGNMMDPNKRAEADQFWLETFMEEKARLHGNKSP
eukprot:scaffold755_cov101-Cylindrotheca_fusiformis.AAC.2